MKQKIEKSALRTRSSKKRYRNDRGKRCLQVILTGDRTAVVDRAVIFSPASMLKIEPKIIRIAGVFFRVDGELRR